MDSIMHSWKLAKVLEAKAVGMEENSGNQEFTSGPHSKLH
jgi:hypothetical protein